MRFYTRIAQTYGGIARIPLGRNHVYLVSEPGLLHELLITNRNSYMKNIRYRQAQELIGLGLLLGEGEVWKRQRRISNRAFTPAYVYEQVPWMAEVTESFLGELGCHADTGRAIDVQPVFTRLAQLLVGEMILGPHFREIANSFCEAVNAVKNCWPTPPRGLLGMLRPPPLIKLARFRRELSRLDALTYEFLRSRRQYDFKDTGIVTTLMQPSPGEDEPFSDEELRDQIMTLFFAGHETSASALSWIHYLLSSDPEVRDQLQAEVREVTRGRTPTARDLKELSYVEQVLNESLRLCSPIHSISRVAIEDNSIDGYTIPKGATVVVSLFATHRLPEYWPDPERFDPARFDPDASAGRTSCAFIPFASGLRNCIGGSMAGIELKLIVAQLAQRYRLELAPGHRVEFQAGTTMYPRYGMKMTLHSAQSQREAFEPSG